MKVCLLLIGALLAAGCSGPGTDVIRVGVASSLTEAIAEIGDLYDRSAVDLSVAGSQVLVAQVREGAPLDVVITADERTLSSLADLGRLDGVPVRFAGNRLAIAVAPGNPLGIDGLSDLAADLLVVIAAPDVPAGAYTSELLAAAGVDLEPDSLEPSARSVLAKVELGEADAGIVYETDLQTGDVSGVIIPDAANVATSYYAAVVAGASGTERARDFVEFLRTDSAAGVLDRLGFRR